MVKYGLLTLKSNFAIFMHYIAQDSSVYAKRVSEALVQRTVDLDKSALVGATKGSIRCSARRRPG